ncbi:hypothetical protein AAHA92_24519 [Salvia divinorum]|uniref:Uncharacterized protein n=1 Tax=Salvia divinorum TaxID=28513 RepID=A0ABD1G7L4_SALDI
MKSPISLSPLSLRSPGRRLFSFTNVVSVRYAIEAKRQRRHSCCAEAEDSPPSGLDRADLPFCGCSGMSPSSISEAGILYVKEIENILGL